MDNVARATALMAQRDHIRPGASVAYRLDVYMEMADTLPGIVAEVARLRQIEAAAKALLSLRDANGEDRAELRRLYNAWLDLNDAVWA